MTIQLGAYSKFITAIIGQAVTFISLYYPGQHWVAIIIAAAAALGVYAVPNSSKQPAVTEK